MTNYHIDQETYSAYQFFAVPKSNSQVSKLIKCMAFAEKVNIEINDAGMKMAVEEAKCLQVAVFLAKEIFQIYHVKDDQIIKLKISLKEMLDCLKKMSPEGGSKYSSRIESSPLGMRMHFLIEHEEPVFKMMLLEDSVETYFRMKGEEYDELIEFELHPVVVKIMMKAQEISEYFKTIEDVSPDIIGIKVLPHKSLIISAECNEGSVELILPTMSDAIETFDCAQIMNTSYKLSNIRHAIRIMGQSTKCALKLDPRGILCFNFLIEGETDSFVEYYCLPQLPDSQEEQFE